MSRSKNYYVPQVTFGTGIAKNCDSVNSSTISIAPNENKTNTKESTSNNKRFQDKSPSCFVCARLHMKRVSAGCEKFITYSPRVKRKSVMDAKRCLNCFSVEYFVRE